MNSNKLLEIVETAQKLAVCHQTGSDLIDDHCIKCLLKTRADYLLADRRVSSCLLEHIRETYQEAWAREMEELGKAPPPDEIDE